MGVIKWFIAKMFYPVLFGGAATYWAFSLGK
jgi:hypothetical protein